MAFESVQNYYEKLVFSEIASNLAAKNRTEDNDFLEDAACMSLNNLPARYVRHHVDLAFYLTAEERLKIETNVRDAVSNAITFIDNHRREQP